MREINVLENTTINDIYLNEINKLSQFIFHPFSKHANRGKGAVEIVVES